MAEVIGLASGIATLIAATYTSCQTLSNTIDGIKSAPKYVGVIGKDLQDFYRILGTLQALLDDGESTAGIVQSATSENLSRVLENSISIFADINKIVSDFSSHGSSTEVKLWRRIRWTFKDKEVGELRRNLTAHKITLNLAISVANLSVFLERSSVGTWLTCTRHILNSANAVSKNDVNLSNHIQEIQEKLPAILRQIEDAKATQLPMAPVHAETDRAKIRVDYDYALRHYLDNAASIVSDITTQGTPSMQVSSLQASKSAMTSEYKTAVTDLSRCDNLTTRLTKYEISIHDVNKLVLMILKVWPDDTIKTVKKYSCYGWNFPNTELYYAGQELSNPTMTLSDYGILQNSCLYNTSKAEDIQFTFPWYVSTHVDHLVLQDVYHKTWEIEVKPGDRIGDVKERYRRARFGAESNSHSHKVELLLGKDSLQDECGAMEMISAMIWGFCPSIIPVFPPYECAIQASARKRGKSSSILRAILRPKV